jgi:threo-3-hydroxy-L-aspartate ammonia-lyase
VDVVLVNDDEIRTAMRAAEEHLGVRCEPGGAAALAAVLASRLRQALGRIGVVLIGGNIAGRRFETMVDGIKGEEALVGAA